MNPGLNKNGLAKAAATILVWVAFCAMVGAAFGSEGGNMAESAGNGALFGVISMVLFILMGYYHKVKSVWK